MKYKRDVAGAVEIDGSPEEIAAYHLEMAKKAFPNRRGRSPRNLPICGTKRASYSSAERTVIISLANKGKSFKQIARHLNRKKISPITRTSKAIHTEYIRMMKDPNRR